MKNYRKRHGDRKDARLIRDVDGMHVIQSYIMGERIENEAILNIDIDARPIDEFLARKNASGVRTDKYTYLQVFIAAMSRTIALRPRMNYFVANNRYYERDEISFAFVAKRYFEDSSDEIIIFSEYDPDAPSSALEQIHERYKSQVFPLKKDRESRSVKDPLKIFSRIPGPVMKLIGVLLKFMNKHGILPGNLRAIDPTYTTCFISNLGSIDMNANYHHLTNWGTNSIFIIIGKKYLKPVFHEDGSYEMIPVLPLSFTIDERIADGLYFHKSLQILQDFLAHPGALEEK